MLHLYRERQKCQRGKEITLLGMSHVTYTNESFSTQIERVAAVREEIALPDMSHVTHMNESFRKCIERITSVRAERKWLSMHSIETVTRCILSHTLYILHDSLCTPMTLYGVYREAPWLSIATMTLCILSQTLYLLHDIYRHPWPSMEYIESRYDSLYRPWLSVYFLTLSIYSLYTHPWLSMEYIERLHDSL